MSGRFFLGVGLPEGSYALGMVIPDPNVPDEPPEHPGPIDSGLEDKHSRFRTGVIGFASPIKAELWAANLKKVRGESGDDGISISTAKKTTAKSIRRSK